MLLLQHSEWALAAHVCACVVLACSIDGACGGSVDVMAAWAVGVVEVWEEFVEAMCGL